MSETLFREVRYDLESLVKFIALGELALPDLQRPFVWSNVEIRDLCSPAFMRDGVIQRFSGAFIAELTDLQMQQFIGQRFE